MAIYVKCLECNKKFDRETVPWKKHGRRYIHDGKCYEQFMEKHQQELDEEKIKERENQHRLELIDYAMELQGTTRPHGLMLKQIKELRDKGFSYQGMKSTLYYFHEIMGNPVLGDGIGIVPFVYDDAIDWFTLKVNSEKHYKNLKESGEPLLNEKRKIVVPKEKKEDNTRNKKINIEDL